ncbi:GatB/YqeY domain-containing protein [Patescibacteria group bacterium]|nr:GatB/YqeY domain-containing protein [Patescibacteria group bacterium]
MTLADRIAADLSTAMKQKEASVVDTLRMLRAAVKNVEIDKQRPLADEEILAVLRTSLKQLADAKEQFVQGDRKDLVQKTEAEMVVLNAYLPPEMSDGDLEATVRAVVADVGATSAKDFGKVMGAVVLKVGGNASGGRVSAVVKTVLGSL